MKITVKVEPDTCIAAANCVGVFPKLFQIGAETYVELLDQGGEIQGTEHTFDATPEELEFVHEAADSCPTRAIHVTEHA